MQNHRSRAFRQGLLALLFIFQIALPALGSNLVPIQNASSNTQFLEEFEVPTIASAPLAITVDHSGVVWFTESNASKLGSLDPKTGSFSEFVVPGVGDMWGITTDQRDVVWFTQYAGKGSVNPGGEIVLGGTGRIGRFDPATQNFTFVNVPGVSSFPMRIVVDSSNRIWFTEFLGNKIGMYDPGKGQLAEYTIPTNSSGPADLAFGANGELWFTEAYAKQVSSFFPQNQSFREYHLGSETPSEIVSSPVGIGVDQQGNVWSADHGGNWVVEFDPSTGQMIRYPTHFPPAEVYPISIPNGVLVDSTGRVWFTEHGGNSIAYIEPDGNGMVEFQIPSGPISTALWIALAPDGNVWFAEWATNKIGVVHANLQTPVELNVRICPFSYPLICQLTYPNYLDIEKNTLTPKPGERTTMTLALERRADVGTGAVESTWGSYNPNEISVTFYSELGADTGAVMVHLVLSTRVLPGNYLLGLGLDLGTIRIWRFVPVEVS